VHGHDLAILPALRIADGRHHEAHLQASLPVGLCELVREEQRVAVAALAKMINRLIDAKPFGCNVGPIPCTEVESVGSCLQNNVTNNLLPGHSVLLGGGVRRNWLSINKMRSVR